MKKAIFGLGISARGVIDYLLRHNETQFYIINQGNPQDWELPAGIDESLLIPQDQAYDILGDISQIILSPGIALSHPILKAARKINIEIISEIEFTFQRSSTPVIGITGSNGKTSCVMMIDELLKKHGLNTFLGGNIGVAYSQILDHDYDVAIIELSSFQLETIKTFRPQIALITNITTGHTERYSKHSEYVDAKKRLCLNRPDSTFIGEHTLCCVFPDAKVVENDKSLDLSKSLVFGEHNQLNFSMSIAVVKEFLKNQFQESLIGDFINSFKPAHFRCELIYNKKGLKIFNDGKSTSLEATQTAYNACAAKRTLMILGGKLRSRNVDLKILRLDDSEIYYFGELGELIKDKTNVFKNLKDLVGNIKFDRYDSIIFSPAFPSFDLYKNYIERAQDFNQLIFDQLRS